MFFKEAVEWKLQGITKILLEADQLWTARGQDLVVTSLMEGTHGENSKHYVGKAVDLRTRYFSTEEKLLVADALRKRLGRAYYVLAERTHIHVHYKG